MITITVEQLERMGACADGIEWFKEHEVYTLKKLVTALLKDNHADYARWLLSNLMTSPQNVRWAIYAAKLALPVFEKHFPRDGRPRAAIQAAQDVLDGKIGASAAASAAWSAAASAASAAWSAESAAASAASAAWSAARSAAASAASAAASAAWAAEASAAASAESAASAARSARNKKLVAYALNLLGE